MGIVGLYYRTLCDLMLSQIAYRFLVLIKIRRVNVKKKSLALQAKDLSWITYDYREQSYFGNLSFVFLSQKKSLESLHPLRKDGLDLLWIYNLFYFDDLRAKNARIRKSQHTELFNRWLEVPLFSGVGWDPYPASLRAVNLAIYQLQHGNLDRDLIENLGCHGFFIEKNIEWHLRGNHVFSNAKALYFLGAIFSGDDAKRWFKKAKKIILEQLREQVLITGAHFELTPMYHSIFLMDVLDIINLSRSFSNLEDDCEFLLRCKSVAVDMIAWLKKMTHPDGELAFFNDSTMMVAPRLSELCEYASQLGLDIKNNHILSFGQQHLDYLRIEMGDAVSILDVTEIGPKYLPGHSHADSLSFELSINKQRFIVNTGISTYGDSDLRIFQRGTSAHSTLEVASCNSSEIWRGFRVGRKAYPFGFLFKTINGCKYIRCSHNGYRHLRGCPIHTRKWFFANQSMIIHDKLNGGQHYAVARYIFHPSVAVVEQSRCSFDLLIAGIQKARIEVLKGLARIECANYAPRFGEVVSTQSLLVEMSNGRSNIKIFWN